MSIKTSIGHKFIHKQELFTSMAPTDELHEVAVPQPAYDLHLGLEFLPTLIGVLRYPFYSDMKIHIL